MKRKERAAVPAAETAAVTEEMAAKNAENRVEEEPETEKALAESVAPAADEAAETAPAEVPTAGRGQKKIDKFKLGRVMYIIEAALEYFVSIAVGTVYLARITNAIGMSEGLTNILTSFVSLGLAFQVVAIFLANRRPVKRWVTALHVFSQTLFALLFFIPIFHLSTAAKTAIFIVSLFLAQAVHNAINSPKISWSMSLVDNDKRGRYTANKQIVSLITGLAFTYALGAIIDHYSVKTVIDGVENAEMQSGAFIVCGSMLFGIMLLHTLSLLLIVEKKPAASEKASVKNEFRALFKEKNLFKVMPIMWLWNVATYAMVSFTGTYQQGPLGFSATYSSIVIMVGCLCRAVVERPIGKIGDRFSFANMLIVCFSIEAVAFALNIFTVPSNGKVLYMIFYILYSCGQAGTASATINLIYDYVDESRRTSAYALSQTFAGLAGFLITLALTPIATYVKDHGNRFFGLNVYAPQVFSAFSLLVTVGILLYIHFVVKRLSNKRGPLPGTLPKK